MWRRADLVRTDVSEEHIASIFRVEILAIEEPALAGTETSVDTRSTRRHIPEDGILLSSCLSEKVMIKMYKTNFAYRFVEVYNFVSYIK
jgi:hypothetical protein